MNTPDSNTPETDAKTIKSGTEGDANGKSCLLIATLVAAGIIGIAFFAINQFKQDLPPTLTRESFDAAWDRWQVNAPADYHIRIKVVGPQPATYRVEVQDNVVIRAERNGNPLPPQPRTMRTWSVPGMFDTMEHDVMRVEKPEPSQLNVRAEFDEEFGYPTKYHRHDGLNKFEMRWTVEEFGEDEAGDRP